MLRGLDHVNVRTSRLELIKSFYMQVLGLAPDRRPRSISTTPRIDRFAFRAQGLAQFSTPADRPRRGAPHRQVPSGGSRRGWLSTRRVLS
jgi:hypothetical protein